MYQAYFFAELADANDLDRIPMERQVVKLEVPTFDRDLVNNPIHGGPGLDDITLLLRPEDRDEHALIPSPPEDPMKEIFDEISQDTKESSAGKRVIDVVIRRNSKLYRLYFDAVGLTCVQRRCIHSRTLTSGSLNCANSKWPGLLSDGEVSTPHHLRPPLLRKNTPPHPRMTSPHLAFDVHAAVSTCKHGFQEFRRKPQNGASSCRKKSRLSIFRRRSLHLNNNQRQQKYQRRHPSSQNRQRSPSRTDPPSR